MSTLRANTVSNSAGTGSPAITGGELSRARFNLNGTGTIAERGSFNIASYVDNGTGDYTSNFSTAFPNGNYSSTARGENYAAGNAPATIGPRLPSDQITSSIRMNSRNTFSPWSSPDLELVTNILVGDRP